MEIEYISTTEEYILNEDYEGLRQCRIEAIVSGKHWPIEVGHIRTWDSELFDLVREAIHGPVGETDDEG